MSTHIIPIDEISYDPRVIVYINDKKKFKEALEKLWEKVFIFELPDGTWMCLVESDVMWVCKSMRLK